MELRRQCVRYWEGELRRQCVRYWEDGTEKTVCEILGRWN